MARGRIFIVEDEALSALDLRRILERVGYAVKVATSGEEAVALTGFEQAVRY